MDQKLIKRIKRRDTLARWIITAGGFAIIFCVIFILLLIARVSFPLFADPEAHVVARFQPEGMAGENILASGVDEYLENAYVLTRGGELVFFALPSGSVVRRIELEPPGAGDTLEAAELHGDQVYTLLWSGGAVTVDRVAFASQFDEDGNRTIVPRVERQAELSALEDGEPVRALARVARDGTLTRISLTSDNRLLLDRVAVTQDIFGRESREEIRQAIDGGPDRISALTLDEAGDGLYAGTDNGVLLRWDLSDAREPQRLGRVPAFDDQRQITALTMVYGDISLAVGDEKGGLSTWFPVSDPSRGGEERLRLIHELTGHPTAVTRIIASRRDKSLISLDRSGIVHLDHMTSERHLIGLDEISPLRAVGFSTRGTGLVGIGEDAVMTVWALYNPHPEVSLKTLFGKVWYESYDQPVYAWQSSSSSDDFEPKLSLTPLIFGTLKGTFYAMLLAVPLALLGAIYTSQFARPRFRELIKPTVEVMAAIPTVVIGFLAALWFAPLLERNIVAFFLSLAFVPTSLILAIVLWQPLRRVRALQRIERGYEFISLLPVLILAVAVAFVLGPVFEGLLFGGDFTLWMFSEGGLRYDQRNSIVISFGLGFAVIPIIFTIAEDSLSNVPSSLRAASLAMGASRWQTVWRVILPSASPGIFAGVMIGLGRAIGETMIVLMATGNTAIMSLSPFNGMRPLSSNIAVEIPEAPVGGTLYRILFLSAVILFVMTFLLNTVAEVVRQRLRRKYGQF